MNKQDDSSTDEPAVAGASADEADARVPELPAPTDTGGRTVPRALAAAGLLFLTVHFVFTAIYINPISVIGLAWRVPITAYLEPLFRQRWSLFAPDPPMLDRRLDYQCEVDGQSSEWVSRSEDLLETHARWRFSPAARLRRLETAAIVATVGSADLVFNELLASQDDASDEQRERVEDMFAQRVAASIVSSETAYRLVLAYCREDLGRDPDRMRYRVVTQDITPYSLRNDPDGASEPQGMTLPWLGPDEFNTLELRAQEYLAVYEQQKRERAEAEARGETVDSAVPSGMTMGELEAIRKGGENDG